MSFFARLRAFGKAIIIISDKPVIAVSHGALWTYRSEALPELWAGFLSSH
jgi:hypothetical protein